MLGLLVDSGPGCRSETQAEHGFELGSEFLYRIFASAWFWQWFWVTCQSPQPHNLPEPKQPQPRLVPNKSSPQFNHGRRTQTRAQPFFSSPPAVPISSTPTTSLSQLCSSPPHLSFVHGELPHKES
ncbi:hypothetical protein M0R45_000238 [Rubus argutus]|uniref:Uncharacterized protein n=1 Tax=Rubus argutus TaxID=59490 RepID=A0AAW1VPV6_RUBAR